MYLDAVVVLIDIERLNIRVKRLRLRLDSPLYLKQEYLARDAVILARTAHVILSVTQVLGVLAHLFFALIALHLRGPDPQYSVPRKELQTTCTRKRLMTDLLHVLPDFPTNSYTHLIPSLERHHISTTDLLTLDALEIAKRARLPLLDLRRLAHHILCTLQNDLGLEKSNPSEYDVELHAPKPAQVQTALSSAGREVTAQRPTVSTLDRSLDDAIGGGIPTGYVTEIVGERYEPQFEIFVLFLWLIVTAPSVVLGRLNISSRSSFQHNCLHLKVFSAPLFTYQRRAHSQRTA